MCEVPNVKYVQGPSGRWSVEVSFAVLAAGEDGGVLAGSLTATKFGSDGRRR